MEQLAICSSSWLTVKDPLASDVHLSRTVPVRADALSSRQFALTSAFLPWASPPPLHHPSPRLASLFSSNTVGFGPRASASSPWRRCCAYTGRIPVDR